jgi:glutathione S-transferase
MAITFYYGSGSPYAWRVWLALEQKALAYDLKAISFSEGDHKKPEFLKLNPRHRVPVIVDGGFALYESAAIVEYLDEQYSSGGKLFPGDPKQRAIIRRVVREADTYVVEAMDPLVELVLFTKRENWNQEAISAAREKFGREMGRWEAVFAGDYLADGLSAADFTLYPMLALCLRIDIRKPDVNVASLIGPKLNAWMKRVEALPYFGKTIPPHWKQK